MCSKLSNHLDNDANELLHRIRVRIRARCEESVLSG